jgi:pilus assembly protein CpaF
MESAVTATQEIYRFHRKGIAPDGSVIGEFEPTGIRPKFAERLAVAGVQIPLAMFAEGFGR